VYEVVGDDDVWSLGEMLATRPSCAIHRWMTPHAIEAASIILKPPHNPRNVFSPWVSEGCCEV